MKMVTSCVNIRGAVSKPEVSLADLAQLIASILKEPRT